MLAGCNVGPKCWRAGMFSSAQIEAAATVVSVVLSGVTIWVLVKTKQAAEAQAQAANKLTEATERQIAASDKQANASKEQVEFARRQITESLRPILIAHVGAAKGTSDDKFVEIKNEGAGIAFDVWWAYGKPSLHPEAPYYRWAVGVGILAPETDRSISVNKLQLNGNPQLYSLRVRELKTCQQKS
jgi:hypothetical protein